MRERNFKITYSCVGSNLNEYLTDPGHMASLEKVVNLATDSIIKVIASEFMGDYDYHIPPRFKEDRIPVACKVSISDETKTKHYEGFYDDGKTGNILSGKENGEGAERTKQSNPANPEQVKEIFLRGKMDPEKFASFDKPVFGEYLDETDEIILYPNAMAETGKKGNDLTNLLISVLVHKLFHHFHFKEMHFWENEDIRKHSQDYVFIVLEESLAAAFEHAFIRKILEDVSLADELSDSWKWHSVLVYPSAGAETVLSGNGYMNGHDSMNMYSEKTHRLYGILSELRKTEGGLDDYERILPMAGCMDKRCLLGDFSLYYGASLKNPSSASANLISKNFIKNM